MRIVKRISGKVNDVIFIAYLFIVWSIYIFVSYMDIAGSKLTIFLFMMVILGIICWTAPGILKQLKRICISSNTYLGKKKKNFFYCIFCGINFLVLYIWFLAYYPGAFSPDSLSQYQQAISGSYNDWHPVWHTLLVFTLPLKITGQVSSIVLFQIIYFSIILGYMVLTIYEFGTFKCACLVQAFILLNPYTGCIVMYPWKDVTFAITAVFAMTCIVKNYFTNGQWLEKKGRVLLLAVVLANATLFRHNAILFTGVLIVGLYSHMNRKKWLQLLLCFLAFLAMIKGPLYWVIDVEQPDKRKTETMGLPLTIIANVTKENPEVLDKQTAEFVYSMATQEQWVENYNCGDFNSIKWLGIDTTVVEETSFIQIIKMTFRCIKVSPKSSLQALFRLTDMVYALDGEIEGDVLPEITVNEFGIDNKGNEKILSFVKLYKQLISESIFKYAFCYIGMTNLIMIAFIMAKSNLKKRSHWKRISLCIPIFTYNFGTMLLLTGPDSRFFYVSYLVCPLIVLLMIRNSEPAGELIVDNKA